MLWKMKLGIASSLLSLLGKWSSLRSWPTFASALFLALRRSRDTRGHSSETHLHAVTLHLRIVGAACVDVWSHEGRMSTWPLNCHILIGIIERVLRNRWVWVEIDHACASTSNLDAHAHDVWQFIPRLPAIIVCMIWYRCDVHTCAEALPCIVLLSVVAQLCHGCILANLFNCVFLDNLAKRLFQ